MTTIKPPTAVRPKPVIGKVTKNTTRKSNGYSNLANGSISPITRLVPPADNSINDSGTGSGINSLGQHNNDSSILQSATTSSNTNNTTNISTAANSTTNNSAGTSTSPSSTNISSGDEHNEFNISANSKRTSPYNTRSSRSIDITQSSTSLIADSATAAAADILAYQPDPELMQYYRNTLVNFGLMKFLKDFVPERITKIDLCRLVLNLGYPKESISNQRFLTTKQVAGILVSLILNDPQVNQSQSYSDFAAYHHPTSDYTIPKLLSDLTSAKKIMVISGAGISTSLGIPDFRSFKGLYAQLEHLNLKDPQKVFDMGAFQKDPSIFYSIAHLVLPPEGRFSMLHSFIKLLQDKGKLLRNYTQNIDNLESRVGIHPDKLIQCHGSFGSASCLTCSNRFAGHKIFEHIRHQHVPRCSTCWKTIQEAVIIHGVIKPDITFFGEDLPKKFYRLLEPDCQTCDLVIVVGTSLKVEPVSSIIDKIPRSVPRVLINKDPIPDRDFDLSLIGLCDDVVCHLTRELGASWDIPHPNFVPSTEFTVTPHELYSKSYNIVKKET